MKESVFQIPKKSDITWRDSRKDIGRSLDLEMKRDGLEIMCTSLNENEISVAAQMLQHDLRRQDIQFLLVSVPWGPWNSGKNEKQRDHDISQRKIKTWNSYSETY